VLVEHGLERMYSDEYREGGEDVIFYLTVYNEPVVQPAMPEHVDDQQIIDGLYRYARPRAAPTRPTSWPRAPSSTRRCVPSELLADDWDVAADVWSAPGWNRLLRNGIAIEAWNRTNPEEPKVPLVTRILEDTEGPYVAVSDWMRATPVPDRRLDPGALRGAGHRRLRPLRHPREAASLPPGRRRERSPTACWPSS
jgi:pyruvate dehydrogenase E1 component